MAQLKNTSINDTGFLQLPSGTTAQRPTSPANGQMRYNTTLGYVEWYDATYGSWFPAGFIPPIATGGTVSNITQGGVNYRVHSFTTTGTSTFTVTRSGPVEFLIVAGGGGGGSHRGSGGGAGGALTGYITATAGSYNIVVGAGGNGGTGSDANGTSGANSSAFNYTAVGGGNGVSRNRSASSGGSGGGGGTRGQGGSGTPGQGNSGGAGTQNSDSSTGSGNTTGHGAGGGGGGASDPGRDARSDLAPAGLRGPGEGGIGISSLISGSISFYAGGGGGGGDCRSPAFTCDLRGDGGLGGGGNGGRSRLNSSRNGISGQSNTGGGGGGGGQDGSIGNGGNGGSGIVIVRYRTS